MERKNEVIRDLLRLTNREELPQNFNNKQLFRLAKSLFNENVPQVEIPPFAANTPLHQFNDYIRKKCESGTKSKLYGKSEYENRKESLRNLVPDWNELKNDDQAQELCSCLENWASSMNLKADWGLEFILKVLIDFTHCLKYELIEKKRRSPATVTAISFANFYNQTIEMSGWNGLSDWEAVSYSAKKLPLDPSLNFSPFVFKYKKLTFPPCIWFPTMTSREVFISEVLAEFDRIVALLKFINKKTQVGEKFLMLSNGYFFTFNKKSPTLQLSNSYIAKIDKPTELPIKDWVMSKDELVKHFSDFIGFSPQEIERMAAKWLYLIEVNLHQVCLHIVIGLQEK
jgi:hypothetical protein